MYFYYFYKNVLFRGVRFSFLVTMSSYEENTIF